MRHIGAIGIRGLVYILFADISAEQYDIDNTPSLCCPYPRPETWTWKPQYAAVIAGRREGNTDADKRN